MLRRRSRSIAVAIWAVLVSFAARAENAPFVEIRLSSGGLSRVCRLHAPAGAASGKALPLLLVFHGGGGTAEGQARLAKGRFEELADRDRWVVAYPQGIGKSWNDGRADLRSKASREGVDDVAFVRDLIAELARRYPIDRRRVFAAGMSNGGMMAMRLGCSLAEELRGVAAVAASLSKDASALCPATTAVSALEIDGTSDPIVPFDGGPVKILLIRRGDVLGAPRTAELWAKRAGCRIMPASADLPASVDDGTRVRRIEYPDCRAGARVVLYRVENGGHAWPGGVPYLGERLIGKTSANLSAADTIWGFFSALR